MMYHQNIKLIFIHKFLVFINRVKNKGIFLILIEKGLNFYLKNI